MNTTRMCMAVAATMLIAGMTGCSSDKAKTDNASATLENLQKAFSGESNAKARYEAFAKKADEEGYLGVSGLFRAAAKAEANHAAKFEKQIVKLGAVAKLVAVAPEVKTTKENIQAAINGETDESTNIYAAFAEQATADKNNDAAHAFSGTAKVEAAHASLYSEILAKMEDLKKAKKDYALCPVCGFVATADADIKKCPVCFEPREKFEIVN